MRVGQVAAVAYKNNQVKLLLIKGSLGPKLLYVMSKR
jgi:hypothetical protein